MAIGTLLAKIVLDEPRKVHYGSNDAVTGKVVLTYTPSTKTRAESNPELFGPLQVAVVFHGRSKTKIWKRSGNNTHIYRGRAPLFSLTMRIYNDSFRAKPNEQNQFPFELRFPERSPGNGGIYWEDDGRFKYDAGDPLPPTFSNGYHGFSNRYECFVEYRVGVQVAMPRLQIIVAKPDKYDEPLVYYDKPRLLAPMDERPKPTKGHESVSNEFLLPEADRPTGFKAKAKAAFSSNYYPTYAFDWEIKAPQNLYIGQPLVFEVTIRPRQSNTAVLIPDVHLSGFSVELRAAVDARAEKQIFTSPEANSDEVQVSLRGVMDDSRPFSKANDWTKTVNTRELRQVCTSFKTPNISVGYRMRVRGNFELAGKSKDFDHEYAVTIRPPLKRISSSAEAGSSSQPFGMNNVEAALPEYDRPPEYDEAVNEGPEAEIMNKKEVEPTPAVISTSSDDTSQYGKVVMNS